MKTQNNIQKTVTSKLSSSVLRGAVIIFGVALISLTVSAQDLWQQLASNNTYEKMASLFGGQPSETKNTDAAFEAIDAEVSAKFNHSYFAFNYEPEIENKLKVEAWMVDESNFNRNVDYTSVEKEETLNIEEWMVNTSSFTSSFATESVEQEKTMEIEPWMLSEENFIPVSTVEPAQNIEYWMLDIKNFRSKNTQNEAPENEPMPIEPWMTNKLTWGI